MAALSLAQSFFVVGKVIKVLHGAVATPSVPAINQPFLLHACVRRALDCSFLCCIDGREVGRANRGQLHRDAIPWGIDSSVLMLSEL